MSDIRLAVPHNTKRIIERLEHVRRAAEVMRDQAKMLLKASERIEDVLIGQGVPRSEAAARTDKIKSQVDALQFDLDAAAVHAGNAIEEIRESRVMRHSMFRGIQ